MVISVFWEYNLLVKVEGKLRTRPRKKLRKGLDRPKPLWYNKKGNEERHLDTLEKKLKKLLDKLDSKCYNKDIKQRVATNSEKGSGEYGYKDYEQREICKDC